MPSAISELESELIPLIMSALNDPHNLENDPRVEIHANKIDIHFSKTHRLCEILKTEGLIESLATLLESEKIPLSRGAQEYITVEIPEKGRRTVSIQVGFKHLDKLLQRKSKLYRQERALRKSLQKRKSFLPSHSRTQHVKFKMRKETPLGLADELESLLIPLILDRLKDSRKSWERRDVDPRLEIDESGITIECSKEHPLYQMLHEDPDPLSTLLKAKNIPVRQGAQDYISRKRGEPGQGRRLIRINVSLIDLDRLLESESRLYQKSRYKNALYKKGNPDGIDEVSLALIQAIENTLFDKTIDASFAYISPQNRAFVLGNTPSPREEKLGLSDEDRVANKFYDFSLVFEGLCRKHNIPLLPGAKEYVTRKLVPNSLMIKYEFNVLPEDMEQLLLSECPTYVRYRHGISINRLMNPSVADIKEGVICLFPAFLLSDEQYMPRNAGCNMSELISVQLANYIKNHLFPDVSVAKQDFFGHHNSKLTEDLNIDEISILGALQSCMNIQGRLNHQSEEGTRILKKTDTPLIHLCALDEDSRGIYQRFSTVTHAELEQLQSCEIPVIDFLDQLVQVLNPKKEKGQKAIVEITRLKEAIQSARPKIKP